MPPHQMEDEGGHRTTGVRLIEEWTGTELRSRTGGQR